jgi:hypothetical protein
MGANIAGIYGAQIFRQDDKPRYRRGFGVNIAVLAVGLTLAIVRYVDDKIRRRRLVQRLEAVGTNDESNEKVVVGPLKPSEDQPAPLVLESGRRLFATGVS